MALVFVGGLLFWGWIEVLAFIFVSDVVGGLLTLLGVFLTAIIGITFLKKQGLSVLNRVRSDLAKGHPPVVSIADSISLVIGGVNVNSRLCNRQYWAAIIYPRVSHHGWNVSVTVGC